MSKREILAGSTDQTIDVFIQDSSLTTGVGLAGLVHNSAGLACYYRKGATGAATALALATQTVAGAHSDGGFVLIHDTNMKGIYRLDLSDTMVATAGMLTILLYGATNMAPVAIEIEVIGYDKFDIAALCNRIADHARRRTQANVEASANGDTLDLQSLYGFIQQAQNSGPVSGGNLPVYKTDGVTLLENLPVTSDAAAAPIISTG